MAECRIDFITLPHGEGLEPPRYATAGAAGMDIAAACTSPMVLEPGARAAVPTGFALPSPQALKSRSVPARGWRSSTGSRWPMPRAPLTAITAVR